MIVKRRQRVVATLAAALCLWAFPVAAQAAGQFEPNDDVAAAVGPLAGDSNYSAALETAQDEDWYWLSIAGQQQITLSVVFDGGGCWLGEAQVHARLLDRAGKELKDFYAISQDEDNDAQEFHYTTPPEASVYYVQLSGASGTGEPCEYSFHISPASAISTTPAQNTVVSFGEPDDLENLAHGPAAGEALYAGKMDAAGDVDQLYFEAKPGQHIDLELAAWGCAFGDGISGLITPSGKQAIYNELNAEDEGQWTRAELDTEGGGRLYIAISGDAGCDWQFWASPASAFDLAPPAPPPHADPCKQAERSLAHGKRLLHRLERRLHRAQSRAGRGRIHHQIETRRRAIRAAKHRVHVHCPKT